MPVNYSEYPPNWKTEIRPAVLARASHRCEHCGVSNYAVGARDRYGHWHDQEEIDHMSATEGTELFGGSYPKLTRIHLAAAHFPGRNTHNPDLSNLLCLCQRCHLALDRPVNLPKIRLTWRKKRLRRREEQMEAVGQRRLI